MYMYMTMSYLKQELHNVGVAILAGEVEGTVFLVVQLVHVRTGGPLANENPNDLEVALPRCQVQGTAATAVAEGGRRPTLQQQAHCVSVERRENNESS